MVTTKAFRRWIEQHGYSSYGSAASLVRFIIDRFGKKSFLGFYGDVDNGADRTQISRAMERHLGRPLDTVLAEWRGQPARHVGESRMHVAACTGAITIGASDTRVPIRCARNGIGLEGMFRFSTAGDAVRIDVTGEKLAVEIARCQGGSLLDIPNTLGAETPTPRGLNLILDIPAGDYFGVVRTQTAGPISARVAPAANHIRNDRCPAELSPIEIGPNTPMVVARRWRADPCVGSWCPGAGWNLWPKADGRLVWSGIIDEFPSEIFTCDRGCPETPGACQSIGRQGPATLAVHAGQTLHVAARNSLRDDMFVAFIQLLPP